MFSEILKIQPQLDNADLNKMEKSLSGRFSKIAKGFGRGLGIAAGFALGAAVLDKLINPLQEVKAAIDRTLGKADDIVTNAKQFGTSTENLLKLRSLGAVNGVSAETMDLLLNKFQGNLAQAKANPNDANVSGVKNFIGQKDTAEAFFNFITQLQKMNATQRTLIETQTFGEKLNVRAAGLFQSDMGQAGAALSGIDFGKIAKDTEALKKLSDTYTANKTVRELLDLSNKAGVINGGTIRNVNKSEISSLNRENGKIGRSAAAFTAEEGINEINDKLEQLVTEIITNVPIVLQGLNKVVDLLGTAVKGWEMIFDLLKKSPLMRGIGSTIGSFFGGDKK